MNIFSRILLLATALFLIGPNGSFAQVQKHGLTWYTDINQIYELSMKTKKPVFGFFTGSDWCGWCHKLEHDVLEKPGFQKWAKENVILMELDFPNKTRLPEALAQQNASLQQFFKVQGYPTIWIFNMEKNGDTKFNLTPMGSLGYPRSAPGQEEATFIASANDILKKKN